MASRANASRENEGFARGTLSLLDLLFILCIDVLFRMLQVASDNLSLPGVGVGDVKIHTLQFADDLLIFFDGTPRSAAVIKKILDAFSMIS